MMDRRAFLGLSAMGAAGLALDPERLLWVPGAKKIFVPSQAAIQAYPAMLYRGIIYPAHIEQPEGTKIVVKNYAEARRQFFRGYRTADEILAEMKKNAAIPGHQSQGQVSLDEHMSHLQGKAETGRIVL